MRARRCASRTGRICLKSAQSSTAARLTTSPHTAGSRPCSWGERHDAAPPDVLRAAKPRTTHPIPHPSLRQHDPMNLFLQQIANGLVIGSTYAVLALGFALAFTVLRVINFAHPDIFMVGMFTGLIYAFPGPWGFVVALCTGALGAAAV